MTRRLRYRLERAPAWKVPPFALLRTAHAKAMPPARLTTVLTEAAAGAGIPASDCTSCSPGMGAWAPVAVPDEFWTGVDDAACLSLEELPGSSYTALRSGQNVEETVVEDEEPTPRAAMEVTPDVAPDPTRRIPPQPITDTESRL